MTLAPGYVSRQVGWRPTRLDGSPIQHQIFSLKIDSYSTGFSVCLQISLNVTLKR